ncbi:MAG: hypothetical protein V3S41_02405 [Spirochaetia bacterium]
MNAGTAKAPVGLWNLAGRIYHEAIYQGSLSAAGSSTQRLVERMTKNSRYIKRQGRMIQILGSVYLLLVTILPAVTMAELAGGATHHWNLFVATLAGTVHLLVQTGYLMILTLLATSEILAPELYRWPESLPLRPEQAGRLRVMALAREFLLPFFVIVLSYPVAAGIASGGVGVAVATLFVSLTHAVVTLSVIVLASWRLRRTLRSASGNDRRATAVRVFTMAGYGIGILVVIAVMQFGTSFVVSLLDEPRMTESGSLSVLRVISLLPFPTSAAGFVSALVTRRAALPSALPLWMPLVGTGLYAGGALLLLRSALRLIGRRDIDGDRHRGTADVHEQVRDKNAAGATDLAQLTVRTPRAAFRRQVFEAATRDIGMLLALLFPLVIPVAMLMGPKISGAPINVLLYAAPMLAAVMGSWLLVHGLTRIPMGTGPLEASLPLVERDRAFPRLGLCAIIPAAGAGLAGIALMPPGLRFEALLLSTIPAVAAPVGFLVKTSLFGRIRRRIGRVVVEEVYIDFRFFKWLVTLSAVLIVAGGFLALRIVLAGVFPGAFGTAAFLVAVVLAGLIVRFIAGRIFPAAAPFLEGSGDGRQSGDQPEAVAGR